MKIIFNLFLILFIFGCSNTNNLNKNLPNINLFVQQDKYSLILKHHFIKNLNAKNDGLDKITVKTNLSYNTKETLSNKGVNNLKIISGKVDFEILYTKNAEVISGSISSSINTGNISSLYGIDENNNFAKERIARHLGLQLFRKILLIINSSES